MGKDALLIRRRDVMEMLSITKYGLCALVESGVLVPVKLWPGAKSHYRRCEVEQLKEEINREK